MAIRDANTGSFVRKTIDFFASVARKTLDSAKWQIDVPVMMWSLTEVVSCSLEAAVNKSIEEDVKLRLVCQRPSQATSADRDGTIRRTFTLVLLIATRDNTIRYMLLYVTGRCNIEYCMTAFIDCGRSTYYHEQIGGGPIHHPQFPQYPVAQNSNINAS
ncbi:hypothetical protein C8R48DRAFT_668757 [Suillus tomentosus]|nr:hypothetical protein C8R48DRAFT_668757 [Suillus tomentosus]